MTITHHVRVHRSDENLAREASSPGRSRASRSTRWPSTTT